MSEVLDRSPVLTPAPGDPEALDGPSLENVLGHNFVDMIGRDAAVPDFIGVNDDVWSVLALVEASGLVGAYLSFESARRQLFLE